MDPLLLSVTGVLGAALIFRYWLKRRREERDDIYRMYQPIPLSTSCWTEELSVQQHK